MRTSLLVAALHHEEVDGAAIILFDAKANSTWWSFSLCLVARRSLAMYHTHSGRRAVLGRPSCSSRDARTNALNSSR